MTRRCFTNENVLTNQNTLWRKRTHGFRERMKTIGGRLVLKNEDVQKAEKRLSA